MKVNTNQPKFAKPNNDTEQKSKKNPTPSGGVEIGFGSSNMFMSAGRGQDFTKNIATAMAEVIESKQMALKPSVIPLDNSIITDLQYSVVVVLLKVDKTTYYHTVTLGSTGLSPLTSQEMANRLKYNGSMGQVTRANMVYTPTDAVDSIMLSIVKKSLASISTGTSLVFVGGTFIDTDESSDVDSLARTLTGVSVDSLTLAYANESGQLFDLNIKNQKKNNNKVKLSFATNPNRVAGAMNAIHQPLRQDWQVSLLREEQENNNLSLNPGGHGSATLANVAGYIEPVVVQNQAGYGMNQGMMPQQMPGLTMSPNIVINAIDVSNPTINYSLLGIISSLVMTSREMWMSSLVSGVKSSEYRNLGALNKIVNIEQAPSGGSILDFKKAKTPEEYMVLINQLFNGPVTLSLDVDMTGVQSTYLSMFATAAGNGSKAEAARQEIIKSCHELTGGEFPLDFPTSEIFSGVKVIMPKGVFYDKNGAQDFAELDLSTISARLDQTTSINNWAGTSNNAHDNNAFGHRVVIGSELAPDALITGKYSRVMFSGKFISVLQPAALKAGLNVSYDAGNTYATQNVSPMGTIQSAGISANVANFGGINTSGGMFNVIDPTAQIYGR